MYLIVLRRWWWSYSVIFHGKCITINNLRSVLYFLLTKWWNSSFFFFYVNVFFLKKIIYFLYTKINFSDTPVWSIVNRRLIYRMKNSKWLSGYIFLWFFESYCIHHYALFILFLLLFYIFINIDIINNININCAFFFIIFCLFYSSIPIDSY